MPTTHKKLMCVHGSCNTLQHTATYESLSSFSNPLQHTAIPSNPLQHTTIPSNPLQHTTIPSNPLQHTAIHSNLLRPQCPLRVNVSVFSNGSVLQCVAVCCSVSQCVAVCRSVSQCVESPVCDMLSRDCVAVCCSVLQCVAVCCSVLQCVALC